MKCPYYGTECPDCDGACLIDGVRRNRVLIVQLGTFSCECGATIESPVSSCRTKGCKYSNATRFQAVTENEHFRVVTTEYADGSYVTTIVGGEYDGRSRKTLSLKNALGEHDKTVNLLEMIHGH